MAIPYDDEKLAAHESRWQRRGELVVTATFAGGYTWLAATLPSEDTTHVNVWAPLIFLGVLTVVGVYVIVCAETHKGWLPGRRKIKETQISRLVGETAEQAFSPAATTQREQTRAIENMAVAIERMAAAVERLVENDD
jgi:hypothetical protein